MTFSRMIRASSRPSIRKYAGGGRRSGSTPPPCRRRPSWFRGRSSPAPMRLRELLVEARLARRRARRRRPRPGRGRPAHVERPRAAARAPRCAHEPVSPRAAAAWKRERTCWPGQLVHLDRIGEPLHRVGRAGYLDVALGERSVSRPRAGSRPDRRAAPCARPGAWSAPPPCSPCGDRCRPPARRPHRS